MISRIRPAMGVSSYFPYRDIPAKKGVRQVKDRHQCPVTLKTKCLQPNEEMILETLKDTASPDLWLIRLVHTVKPA